MKNEYDANDPNVVTKIHYYFNPSMYANRIHALLEDVSRQGRKKWHVKTVIEEMRRIELNKLYVRIGFRQMDIEEDEEECTGQ